MDKRKLNYIYGKYLINSNFVRCIVKLINHYIIVKHILTNGIYLSDGAR